MYGYLEKGIQIPMAQGRSTKIISMIKWIRTSRLSIKNSLSAVFRRHTCNRENSCGSPCVSLAESESKGHLWQQQVLGLGFGV